MKKLWLLLLALVCISPMFAGGQAGSKRFSLATGGTGGTYYPVGAGIASVVSKYAEGISVNAESTGGSVANLNLIAKGEVELMMGAASTVFGGYKGQEPFEKPITNIRGITALYPETFQFVVLKSSGITSMRDLKGKTIAVGAAGSGTERSTKLILKEYGITYDDVSEQFLGFSEAAVAMRDRLIDAAVVGAGLPTSAIVDISTTLDIDLLPVDESVMSGFVKRNIYYRLETIAPNSYRGVDHPVLAIATPALLVAREDLAEEDVYQIVKALYDHIDELAEIHAQGKNIILKKALEGMSIPLHPGAERFYREQGLIPKS